VSCGRDNGSASVQVGSTTLAAPDVALERDPRLPDYVGRRVVVGMRPEHLPCRLHIGFNMYALYLFGPGLERQVGGPAFLALYLGSAAAGGAAYFLPYALEAGGLVPAVGASGAVFGLFGATLALTYRNRATAAGAAGLRQLLTLLGINLALPLIAPGLNIAWQAHVGGLVAGALIAAVWSVIGRRHTAGALRTAAGVAVGLAALAVVLVV